MMLQIAKGIQDFERIPIYSSRATQKSAPSGFALESAGVHFRVERIRGEQKLKAEIQGSFFDEASNKAADGSYIGKIHIYNMPLHQLYCPFEVIDMYTRPCATAIGTEYLIFLQSVLGEEFVLYSIPMYEDGNKLRLSLEKKTDKRMLKNWAWIAEMPSAVQLCLDCFDTITGFVVENMAEEV
jgi:hypothetical protein